MHYVWPYSQVLSANVNCDEPEIDLVMRTANTIVYNSINTSVGSCQLGESIYSTLVLRLIFKVSRWFFLHNHLRMFLLKKDAS
jgi:Holliday junction resolvase-like predicted endonuclease